MADLEAFEEALEKMIESGDVPTRVTNRLLLVAIIQTREHLETRITELEDCIDENPSISLLMRRKPKETFRFLLVILLILSLVAAAAYRGEELLSFLAAVLGVL